MDNILKIIANEDPNKYLELISKEITNTLKNNLNEEIFLFIYEPSRNVLKMMGNSLNCDSVLGLKIYIDNNLSLLDDLYKEKLYNYFLNEDEKIGCLKNVNSMFLHPIKYNEKLIGSIGILNESINIKEINEEMKNYTIIFNLVIESLSIKELKDKVKLIENFTKIIESTLNSKALIEETLIALKNTFHCKTIVYWELDDDKLKLSYSEGLENKYLLENYLDIKNSVEGESLSFEDGILKIGSHFFETENKPFDFKIRSAMFTPLKVDGIIYGIIGVYNRLESFGYRPYKHFDEFDKTFLNDSIKRLGIALSRINLYNKLKNEIEKLRNLKETHEDLISFQKLHLEKMNALHKISQAVRSTYDKKNAIKIMLLGLTAGRGLRFNRALYLERDRVRGFLYPVLWLGPAKDENVEKIWQEANRRAIRYGNIVQYLREEALQISDNNSLTESIKDKVLAYKGHSVLERVVNKRQTINVVPQMLKIKKEELDDIYDLVNTDSFLIFPVTGKFDTKGIVIVDNSINKEPISNVDIEIIRLFQDSVGLALEMIENYDELRQKTRSLEEQKNLIDYFRRFKENILQNLALAIIVVDRKGKITEWNQKAEVLFSRPRENMMGTKISLFSSVIGEDIINTIEEIYVTKTDLKYPYYKIKISNEKKVFDIQFSPLWNRDLGVIEGVIILFDDVTELYSLQREMERREKLAAIGEMTSRIAHEIRNPLTIIGGFLTRMKKKLDNPEYIKKYSVIIDDELKRLENIVSEILEYSRGKKLPQFQEVILNDIVRDVIIMYEDFIYQKNIMFNTEWMDNNVELMLDKSKIKQVLINLMKNAIEIVDEKGQINIKVGKEDDNAFFEIENNGPPIEEEYQEKLFLPFFTTKTQGTGLGLPICKKIIEDEHKGKLFLLKSDEKSTIFKFILPIKKDDN